MSRIFLFAGGGTGGHLFPGLAIAEALRAAAGDQVRCVFLCSDRPLDTKILSAEGAEFRVLPAQPLGLNPRRLAKFFANWGKSVRMSREIVREFRAGGEVCVVAMGGFVAAPVVQAARVERAPVTLVNLDAAPGKANRWISRHAERGRSGAGVFTALPVDTAKAPYARSWTLVPPIVRSGAVAERPAPECRRELGLDEGRPTLMVTGGSQGAASINDFLLAFAAANREVLSRWQVLHQCGRDAEGRVREGYERAGIKARVEAFVAGGGMATWWGAADLAVSRSGAGSVAEAWANRVPALFLPYPYHRDQHQRLNAQPVVAAGGAVVETDIVDAEKNLAAVGPVLRGLLTDGSKRAAMRAALLKMGPVDGAERIAAALLSGTAAGA